MYLQSAQCLAHGACQDMCTITSVMPERVQYIIPLLCYFHALPGGDIWIAYRQMIWMKLHRVLLYV